jgi:hypothetical protein
MGNLGFVCNHIVLEFNYKRTPCFERCVTYPGVQMASEMLDLQAVLVKVRGRSKLTFAQPKNS